MRGLLFAVPILACLAAWPGHACTIPPPGTPAEEARRTLDDQTGWMRQATTIFLVDIVDARPIRVVGSPIPGRQVVLSPLQALRGDAPRRSLTLRHDAYTTCGLSPWWDVLRDPPGQTYVIFATSNEPRQVDVIAVVRRDRLVQPDLLARLTR